MKSKETLFAVYGTLKQGFGNNRLLAEAEFLGEFRTEPKYSMYSLGGFPAVTLQGNTALTVQVYKTSDPDVVDRVNSLEGFTGVKDDPNNWYDTKTIETPYGEAEMFYFKRQPTTAALVESGNWQRGF
jgi:gamma-glutamylcyclotransferase (GGCT)/AIG2-like uncharacterized protein YtfP